MISNPLVTKEDSKILINDLKRLVQITEQIYCQLVWKIATLYSALKTEGLEIVSPIQHLCYANDAIISFAIISTNQS